MLRRTFLNLYTVLLWARSSQASGAAQPASPKAGATIRVTITGIAFLEVKQSITVGDTIEWINRDVVPHTATARNTDWRVVIPANDRATLVLKKPGRVEFYCEYHPNMTGTLVIHDRR